MKTNTLKREGFEASVQFDTDQMAIIGEVEYEGGCERFESHSTAFIDDAFKGAIKRIQRRQTLKTDLIGQLVSFPHLVQAGDAEISIDPSQSDEHVGMAIKMMLTAADGATFSIREQINNKPEVN